MAEPYCCDLHNHNCEPPSELCCSACSEACHGMHSHDGWLVLSHHDGSACVDGNEALREFNAAALRAIDDLL